MLARLLLSLTGVAAGPVSLMFRERGGPMRRVLACLTVLVGTGCLCGGCARPNHDYQDNFEYLRVERDHRQKLAQSVVDALEVHKQATGRYPNRLDDLVGAGLLPALPDLASNTDHLGKTGNVQKAQPLQYVVVDEGYELRFSFGHFRPALTAADSSHFLYVSRDKKWYLEYGFPPRRPGTAPPRTEPPAKAPADPKEP
jgi:hypothetical protein